MEEMPPFIVRQFERAYTAELKNWNLTGRPDKIRAVSCTENKGLPQFRTHQ